ncbi:MAG: hypothetical protein M3O50_10185, partial [Myxococcota bacterium]|nr:hypothetical protein [Myxococcota bacterium]
GLGVALLGSGHRARGVAALARALELADGGAAPAAPIRLQLARALAEHLDDLPTAVAHASLVGANEEETSLAVAEARGLEGRWRARLGDRAGAALAFSHLRELAATLVLPADPARAAAIAELLGEAADFERAAPSDTTSAEHHLVATPRHAALDDEAEAVARVEELTRRLQGNPRDKAVCDELASLLEALDRGHELLALMSARIEEATPELRTALVASAKAALSRVAARAEANGRGEEAAFYSDAMRFLPD